MYYVGLTKGVCGQPNFIQYTNKIFALLLTLHNIFKTLNPLNKMKILFGPIKMYSLIM